MLGRVLKEVKMPFPDDFFPEMELAPALESDLLASAGRLLASTLRDEAPASRFHPSQRPDQWKQVGDRNGLQLYRERGVAKGNAVRVNILGQLTGSLYDVMLGLYAKDNNAFKTQRAIMHGDYLDAAVLHVVDADPYSEDDTSFSFQFAGIKWMAAAPSGKLVNKRDLCWFEQMGVTTDPAGEEVGFIVMQSVRVDACPPFEQQGLKRSTASVCYVFRPLPNGRVSVFMAGEHAVGGKARSWSTDAVMVEMWLGMGSVMECAQAKRLSNLVSSKEMFVASAPSKACDVCDGKMKIAKAGNNCKICGKNICDRCRMAKLIYPTRNTGNFPCSYPFCKPCLSEVKDRLFGKLASRVSFHSSAESSHSASPRSYRAMPRPGGSMMSSGSSGSSEKPYLMRGGYDNCVRTSSQDVPTHGVRLLHPRSSNASSGMSARGTSSSDSSTFGRPIYHTNSFRGPSVERQGSNTFGGNAYRGHPPPARPAGRSIDGHIPGPPPITRNTSDSKRGSNACVAQTSYARAPTSISSTTTHSSSYRSGLSNKGVSSRYTASAGTLSFDNVYDMDGGDMYRFVGRAGNVGGSGGGYTSEESDYSDVDEEVSSAPVRRPMGTYEADDVDEVIDLTSSREPEPDQPVDVFESDGLKYINTFRANDGAPPAAPSGGGGGGGGSKSTDDLMERLMQINMAAEATYLMAKYNANIQEDLQR